MSSRVRSGKSRRISSSLIPEARYSKTSLTVIRRARTHGFPARLEGSNVIRERQSMDQGYGRPPGEVNLIHPGVIHPGGDLDRARSARTPRRAGHIDSVAPPPTKSHAVPRGKQPLVFRQWTHLCGESAGALGRCRIQPDTAERRA